MLDNIRMAFSSLFANKMRALLTMLGIIIGIGAVIAIVTVGDSLTGSLTDSMQSFGASNITVSLQQKSSGSNSTGGARILMFAPSSPDAEDLLTDGMITEYREAFGERVKTIALSESLGSGTVTKGENSADVMYTGVNADYNLMEGLTLTSGRYIKDTDGERMLAVVSDKFAQALFPGQTDVIGQTFEATMAGGLQKLYIVGVYKYQDDGSINLDGSDPATTVYLPLAAAKKVARSDPGYTNFTVVGANAADSTSLLNDTKAFFASYYTRNDSYTATASSMESMLSTMTEMLNTVKLAIAAIAAISLLVGGIGVMNIMLVSITERTREIGVRKALGARNGAIRLQFITESVVICLVGGALGITVGVGLGSAAAGMLGYPAKPSLIVIALAVGFSMAIGVFFGYYPANKAARLDPIDALRYE